MGLLLLRGKFIWQRRRRPLVLLLAVVAGFSIAVNIVKSMNERHFDGQMQDTCRDYDLT